MSKAGSAAGVPGAGGGELGPPTPTGEGLTEAEENMRDLVHREADARKSGPLKGIGLSKRH